jgi:hypothetical protein
LTVLPDQVEIEELVLPGHGLDEQLLEAFARSERNNPQFGLDWLRNMASHALENHEKAVLYVARQSPDEFIVLPLKLNSRNGRAEALGNFYTSAYSPVICTESPQLLCTALFRHIATKTRAADLILSPLTVDPSLFDQIQTALARSGWRGAHRFFCFGNWIHESLNVTYEDYLADRPSQLRNTIIRRTRHFLEGGKGKLTITGGGASLEKSIDQFTSVYNKSWKREEPFPDFVPALLRMAAQRGWLRLGIATYDEVAIASQIWLVCGGKAYIFKLAHHEEYKQLSPGTVLTAHMMKHVLDVDSVSGIDFLSGDDDFKESWMTARKECFGIAAYNPLTLRGRGLLAWHALKGVLKRFHFRRQPG